MSEQQQDTAKYIVGALQTYLSGIVDQVVKKDSKKNQEQMVTESLTRAFDELHSGKSHHDVRNLFTK